MWQQLPCGFLEGGSRDTERYRERERGGVGGRGTGCKKNMGINLQLIKTMENISSFVPGEPEIKRGRGKERARGAVSELVGRGGDM